MTPVLLPSRLGGRCGRIAGAESNGLKETARWLSNKAGAAVEGLDGT